MTEEGPADAAGLLGGDAILAVDGHAVETPEDLVDLLAGDRVGHPRALRVQRGASAIDVEVVVRARES